MRLTAPLAHFSHFWCFFALTSRQPHTFSHLHSHCVVNPRSPPIPDWLASNYIISKNENKLVEARLRTKHRFFYFNIIVLFDVVQVERCR